MENFYRASEIYSLPGTEDRPPRRGLLPFQRAQFYRLLKSGQFPPPDSTVGETRLWSGQLLHDFLTSRVGQ